MPHVWLTAGIQNWGITIIVIKEKMKINDNAKNHPFIVDFLENNDKEKLLKNLENQKELGFRNGELRLLSNKDWKHLMPLSRRSPLGEAVRNFTIKKDSSRRSSPNVAGCGCSKKTTKTKTKRINMHDCINCTKKHLSSAIVIMNEILNGYKATDHEIYLMGNLNEASEQITGFSLEISNALRDLRVDIFETKKKLFPEHLEKAKKLWYNIDKINTEGKS
jgi:hypothetical protein